MRNSIFYSALTDENGNILVDENGNKLLAEIGITDTEVFQNLTQAYMPKNEKIIKDIIIQIDDDITVEQLSEGEKKLILVKTVLEILSDEKTGLNAKSAKSITSRLPRISFWLWLRRNS